MLQRKDKKMEDTYSQKCPLCQNDKATFVIRDSIYRLFDCQKCSQFVISNFAERKLQTASDDYLKSLSEKASKAEDGKILYIRAKEDNTDKNLECRFDPRSNWYKR